MSLRNGALESFLQFVQSSHHSPILNRQFVKPVNTTKNAMAKDVFGRELKPGDIVIISSTAYAQLHIGIVVRVNKNATCYMVHNSHAYRLSKERIGSVDRLAIVDDHFLTTIDPAYTETLKTAQYLILGGKASLFAVPGGWHSITLEEMRRAQ